ncbi:MAG TPA: hypothetical protein VFK78_01910 [Gemmatimonadales bacterium]|nr:hypothetical protein [Gemmatimonadales bacterium]
MIMDLLQQVATTLKIEEGKAEKGIGAILTALRMTSDKTTFEAVKAAAPNSERWMGRALMSGGRTAEMTAPTNPTTLGAALASAGFKKDEIGTLAGLVTAFLKPVIGDAALEKFVAQTPALRG